MFNFYQYDKQEKLEDTKRAQTSKDKKRLKKYHRNHNLNYHFNILLIDLFIEDRE